MDNVTQYKRKFPSIPHLDNSRSVQINDSILLNDEHFIGLEVIVTEKRDGENTVMGRDYIHARSMDSGPAGWRTMVGLIHGRIKHEIPITMRICGENMQGEHSIHYDNIAAFEVFQITDEDMVLSWDDTVLWCQLLDLQHVPIIYRGIYDRGAIAAAFNVFLNERSISNPKKGMFEQVEGYVIRAAKSFRESDWYMGKWVRPNHVQTDEHWTKNWKPNGVNAI